MIGPKPLSSPSLAGFPECDEKLANIAGEIWASPSSTEAKSTPASKTVIHDGSDLGKVLGGLNVLPDVQVIATTPLLCAAAGAGKIGIHDKGGIVFKHRSSADREIYFLSNTTDQAIEFSASLRVSGRKPELWNANTGAITDALAFTQSKGRTLVPLRLDASESIYIVFSDPIATDAAGRLASNTKEPTVIASLDGPWTVRFDGQDAPEETVFPTLTDWTTNSVEAIRNYSGTAVYQNSFTLDQSSKLKRTILSLGKVADIASVSINGKSAGILWTTPWQLDITDFVQAGSNIILVHVTNQWHNHLLADAAKPSAPHATYISQPYRSSRKTALPSGLLGPVQVLQTE